MIGRALGAVLHTIIAVVLPSEDDLALAFAEGQPSLDALIDSLS